VKWKEQSKCAPGQIGVIFFCKHSKTLPSSFLLVVFHLLFLDPRAFNSLMHLYFELKKLEKKLKN
jgi:hypothetical protein